MLQRYNIIDDGGQNLVFAGGRSTRAVRNVLYKSLKMKEVPVFPIAPSATGINRTG
jgi:hypothetical protein